MSSSANLLVISSAPGSSEDGKLILDRKFVEGMKFYTKSWAGKTACLLRAPRSENLFTGQFDPEDLPFAVHLRPAGHHLTADDLKDYQVILASGDNHEYLHVADLARKAGKAAFYTIEYTPQTRRQIVMLDPNRSLPSRIKSLLNIALTERRRRRAFRQAAGLQANGYPAADLYRQINPNTVFYLDNRITKDLLVTDAEMAARQSHLQGDGPVRLIHSGRLEPMKGSQDLIPIARRMRDQGANFVLDIFGGGSLEAGIRQDIQTHNLGEYVRLHGVVDYETELVPFARQNSDIFLSCHRQSDPSCSYLENMGCGLAVAGYANLMWTALAQDSQAGWVVPLGDWQALADKLIDLTRNRADIRTKSGIAAVFARQHLFSAEFAKRIAQMSNLK